jgi:L-malate glycosyltransferase
MNILLLTHSYPDANNSWQGIFIKKQAESIALSHNVIVVYFKVDYSDFSPFAKYSFSKNSEGNLIEYEVTIKRSFPVLTQLKYLSNTYRFIENEILANNQIDIIHSHLSYPAGFLGTLLQRNKKIPNVLTEHSRVTKYFRSWVHKLCVRYALKNSASLVAVSNSLKEEIISLSNRPLNIITNFVDIGRFELSKTKSEGELNIGFLGELGSYNKGLDILLKAVSTLKENHFALHIGGNGKLLSTYRDLAKQLGLEANCKFYGEILPEDVPSFYSKLDLFVLPSHYETFGIVLIEAMACGIPVIATKCGGPEEIVTVETGLLIEKNNPEELALAINNIWANPEKYNKQTIRKYSADKYGQSVFTEKILNLYESILKKPDQL